MASSNPDCIVQDSFQETTRGLLSALLGHDPTLRSVLCSKGKTNQVKSGQPINCTSRGFGCYSQGIDGDHDLNKLKQ